MIDWMKTAQFWRAYRSVRAQSLREFGDLTSHPLRLRAM